MLEAMSLSYSTQLLNKLTMVETIDIGGLYAFESTIGNWQRCIAIEKLQNDVDTYRIEMIDVGCECDIASSRFRRLLPDFIFPADYAIFAIHVSLMDEADMIDRQVFSACISHDGAPQKFRVSSYS